MHYAIGDVHGCYQAMKKLIGKIEREDADAQFILIGDVIDRGGETPEVLEWCMKNVTRDGKYQMLMGNHELMFMEWCSREWFPYCEGKKKSYEHAHYHADEDFKESRTSDRAERRADFFFFPQSSDRERKDGDLARWQTAYRACACLGKEGRDGRDPQRQQTPEGVF